MIMQVVLHMIWFLVGNVTGEKTWLSGPTSPTSFSTRTRRSGTPKGNAEALGILVVEAKAKATMATSGKTRGMPEGHWAD